MSLVLWVRQGPLDGAFAERWQIIVWIVRILRAASDHLFLIKAHAMVLYHDSQALRGTSQIQSLLSCF